MNKYIKCREHECFHLNIYKLKLQRNHLKKNTDLFPSLLRLPQIDCGQLTPFCCMYVCKFSVNWSEHNGCLSLNTNTLVGGISETGVSTVVIYNILSPKFNLVLVPPIKKPTLV